MAFLVFLTLIPLCFCPNSFGESFYYKVKKGDTFFSISRKFKVEIWVIQKENNISLLKEGDVIKIPVRTHFTYTVRKGDTLFSLARKFNTTIEEVISANRLESIDIKVGQTLVIPSGNAPNSRNSSPEDTKKDWKVYVVERGDTLYSISRKTGINIKKILELNNLSKESLIKPGMIIVLDKTTVGRRNNKKEKLGISPDELKNTDHLLPVTFVERVKNHSSKFLEIVLEREDRVRAVMDGRVIFVGSFSIFGRTVIIKHSDRLYTIYGMLREENVKVGDEVKKGEIIGLPEKDPYTGNYVVKFSFIANDRMFVPNSRV